MKSEPRPIYLFSRGFMRKIARTFTRHAIYHWTKGIETLSQGAAAKRETGKVKAMKSFVMAVVAMAVIGVGAHFGLASLDRSASNVYVTDNVRK